MTPETSVTGETSYVTTYLQSIISFITTPSPLSPRHPVVTFRHNGRETTHDIQITVVCHSNVLKIIYVYFDIETVYFTEFNNQEVHVAIDLTLR